MEDNNNQNQPIEEKNENEKSKPYQKLETIGEAMDRGLSYEEALFGD